jgi:hypothetical protein
MTGATIAQLIIALGPKALEVIVELARIWNKTLTVDEVQAVCAKSEKSYEAYIAEAKAANV